MAEDNKEQSEFPQENQSEKVDNRLPYSPPTLRKHGKINDATNNVFAPGNFDFIDPFILADFS